MDKRGVKSKIKYIFSLNLFILSLFFSTSSFSLDFTASNIGDYGDITVMEVTGDYDANLSDSYVARQEISKEFFKAHPDEYDFIVIFAGFDFKMPDYFIAGEPATAAGFYTSVRNDVQGIGEEIFDNSSSYGSNGRLQGVIDMGFTGDLVSDPLEPDFRWTMTILSHEILHRWAAHIKYMKEDGSISDDILGSSDLSGIIKCHWSYLFDTSGSVLYGNNWQENADGTFTSLPGYKYYSPLDLYLMGLYSKSEVPSMLLIENQEINPETMPDQGVTINGTPHYISVDDIIAAEGERVPSSGDSQKTFKIASILITRPGTFTGDELHGLRVVMNNWVTWFSALTDGRARLIKDMSPQEEIPENPGVTTPAYDPRTSPPEINDGIAWLLANQQDNGSWIDSAQTVERDTAEAVITLRDLSIAEQNHSLGLQWLADSPLLNTDYLSRKIRAITLSEGDAADSIDELIIRQNPDGGWGSNVNYMSTTIDTAFALRALSGADYSDQDVIGPAIEYLKQRQNADNGWGNDAGESEIQSTVNVLYSFIHYQSEYGLNEEVDNGIAWIFGRQNADGGFGNSPSTIYDTAMVMSVLKGFIIPDEVINQALAYIMDLQSENGSWYESPYQTSLAVNTLLAWEEEIKIDLYIDPDDISFSPSTITDLPQEIVVNAEVSNLGMIEVPQAVVALYEGEVSESNKVGEDVISLPGNSYAEVSFNITIDEGVPNEYYVVVDPADQIEELDESNNEAAKTLEPAPDLFPDLLISSDNITIDPSIVTELPQDVSIEVSVENLGRMNAEGVVITLFDGLVSEASMLDEQTISVSGKSTANVTFTTSITDEEVHQYFVVADYDNLIVESDESNNEADAILYNDASIDPDLSVDKAEITLDPAVITILPSEVTIDAVIRNNGMTDVTDAKIALYEDTVEETNKVDEVALDIPSRSYASASFIVTIADGNEHIYYIVTDPDNLVEESVESNNTAKQIIQSESTYDLEILSSDLTIDPSSLEAGDLVTVAAKISNWGTRDAFNVQVIHYLNENGQIHNISTSYVDIPAGSSIDHTIQWTADTAAEDMTLTVEADPDDVFEENSETNNTASGIITVIPMQDPNLVITSQDIGFEPDPAGVFGDVAISASIRNEGLTGVDNAAVLIYHGDPETDGTLLHETSISLGPDSETIVSFVWSDIQPPGNQIIYVQIDPDNLIVELSEDDNNSFNILKILDLPDLTVSTASINFDPVMPKEGDLVSIKVTVGNLGEQYVPTTQVYAYEGETMLGSGEASFIEGGDPYADITFSCDTTGMEGAHEITILVDPEDTIAETNEDNNTASRSLGIQDDNLWLTEKYISPNGDGIKDSTQLFFALQTETTVKVVITDDQGEEVRTFNGDEFDDTLGGSIIWDGLNDRGTVVRDGTYQIRVQDYQDNILSMTPVIVDNNRSPFTDAIDTNALLTRDLSCGFPNVAQREWFPDESGMVFCIQAEMGESIIPSYASYGESSTNDGVTGDYQDGLYAVDPDGEDIVRLVPDEWTSDSLYTYVYGNSKERFVISPDGEHIAFSLTVYRYGNPYSAQLWAVDRYGGELTLLAGNIPLDSTQIYEDFITGIRWSPDSSMVSCLINYDCYDEAYSYAEDLLAIADLEGNIEYFSEYSSLTEWAPDDDTLAFQYQDPDSGNAYLTVVYPDLGSEYQDSLLLEDTAEGIKWLDNENIVIKGESGIWLAESSCENPAIRVADATPLPDSSVYFAVSPDQAHFAFVSGQVGDGTWKLYVGDKEGNCDVIHESQSVIRDIEWSSDGSKLAAFDEITAQWSITKILQGSIIAFDSTTGEKSSFPAAYHVGDATINDYSYDYYIDNSYDSSSLHWLEDNISLIGRDEKIFIINSDDGEKRYLNNGELALETDILVSGYGKTIVFDMQVDENSVCYDTGDKDVYAVSSLLNLSADLNIKRESTYIILKGIATDLNFDYYSIEYADINSPDEWGLIVPYSNIPVINDVLAYWVPPCEGTYFVRLTAHDMAGNRAVSQKRVSWGESSSLINLYKVREIFSPTLDDPEIDSAELHYKVLKPANLIFFISDSDGNLVRILYMDYATIPEGGLEDYIEWDGKDESGEVVPDGEYELGIYDYTFSFTVDTTPPETILELNPPDIEPFDSESNETQQSFIYYYLALEGYLNDEHMDKWVVQYGEGDNPSEWQDFQMGQDAMVAQDDQTDSGSEDQELVVLEEFSQEDLEFAVGKKFRVAAEDLAGNMSTKVTEYPEEVVLLYGYKIEKKDPPFEYFIPIAKNIYGEYVTKKNVIIGKGFLINSFEGVATIRRPIVSVDLQYVQSPWDGVTWYDYGTPVENPGPGLITLPGISSQDCRNMMYIRIKAVDDIGRVFYSNEVPVDYPVPGDLLSKKGTPVESSDADVCGTLSPSQETLSLSFKLPSYSQSDYQYCYLYAETGSEDFQELTCIDINTEELEYETGVAVGDIPEGIYQLKGAIKDETTGEYSEDQDSIAQPMIIDRTLPDAEITYPTGSMMICPVNNSSGENEWSELVVEGRAEDLNGVKCWELYFGMGSDPAKWSQAEDPEGNFIQGEGEVLGTLGVWDITEIKGDVSLRLKVWDGAGNLNCYETAFYIDSEILLVGSVDKGLFSPNGDNQFDDVQIQYSLKEYGYIDVNVYKQIGDNAYELFRALTEGAPCDSCTDSVTWDGMDENGHTEDGIYRIAITGIDVCGNSKTYYLNVEIDITPPESIISFPSSEDTLENTIIEIIGTSDDRNFGNYRLYVYDAGSSQPDIPLAEIDKPVTDDILAGWNWYGCEGEWNIQLISEDEVANSSEAVVSVNLAEMQDLITALSIDPALFSPNNDGKLEETTVLYSLNPDLNEEFDVLLEFYSGGILLESITESSVAGGSHSYVWDGDAGGVVAPDGPCTVYLTASLSSNTSVSQQEKATVKVDTTPPYIEIKNPVDNAFVKENPLSFNGTITDLNISSYEIKLTGPQGEISVGSGNQSRTDFTFATIQDLPEETYTLAANAEDLGLITAEQSLSFTVDYTPPAITISAPQNGGLFGGNNSVVTIKGVIEEKNPESWSLRYSPESDPEQWTELAQGQGLPSSEEIFEWEVGIDSGISDGWYTILLYAKDKAGWESEAKVRIYIDNTPPTVNLTSPTGYVTQAVDITGTAYDLNMDEYTVEIADNGCDSAFRWLNIYTGDQSVSGGVLALLDTLPSDGLYCLRISAVDKAGNSSSASSPIIIDTEPPAAPQLYGKVVDGKDGYLYWTHDQEPDFAGYNLYKDGNKVNTELIPEKSYLDQDLGDNAYVYIVKTVDEAGLESSPSNEVILDLSPPKARIHSPLTGRTVSGILNIKGTAYSDDDFKEYRVYVGEGAEPSAWELIVQSPLSVIYGDLAQWDTTGLSQGGKYSIRLEAEDLEGNMASHQVAVVIDNEFSEVPVLYSAEVEGVNDVYLEWGMEPEEPDDIAGYLLYRDCQLANAIGTVIGDLRPYLLTGYSYYDEGLEDGLYSYYVTAMDIAGNMSEDSNTIQVLVDTGPPAAQIIMPEEGQRFMDTLYIEADSDDLDIDYVQFQYKGESDSDWIDLNDPVTTTPYVTYLDPISLDLDYGEFLLRAVATDLNAQTDPDPVDITVVYTDIIAPETPLNLATLTDGGMVTLTWEHETEDDLEGYNIYLVLEDEREKLNEDPVSGDMTYIHGDSGVDELLDGTYIYEVTAEDIYENESEPSNRATAIVYTPVIEQPYTPVEDDEITYEGSDCKGNDYVEIYFPEAAIDSPEETISADAEGCFLFSAVLSEGENFIYARAMDDAGNRSKFSEPVVVVLNYRPATPTGFAGVAGDEAFSLSWNPNTEEDLTGYNLFRDGEKLNGSSELTSGIASASYNDSYAENALDGNSSTYWYCDFYSTTEYEYWQVDFPSSELVDGVEIDWLNGLSGNNYVIQAWSGYAWITIAEITGNESDENILDITPSYRTDKIRIKITEPADNGEYPKTVQLSEVVILKDNPITAENYEDNNISKPRHDYYLTALDYYGFESDPTDIIPVGDITPPDAPLDLTATVDYADIILTWSVVADDGLAGYNVYCLTTEGWVIINPGLVTGNTYTDPGLPNGTYTYRVTALDTGGNESGPSNEASATVNIGLPDDPINLYVAGVPEGGALIICWESQGGTVAGYRLYRSLTPGGPYEHVNDELIVDTCYEDTGLNDGETYYYIVRAVDEYGNESDGSNEDSGTPQDTIIPDPPVIFSPTAGTDPLEVDDQAQDIKGYAEPGVFIDLFKNGDHAGGPILTAGEDQVSVLNFIDDARNLDIWEFSLSEDGRFIAYAGWDDITYTGFLESYDTTTGETTRIVDDYYFEPYNLSWSPDGAMLAYSICDWDSYDNRIYIYDLGTGNSWTLTDKNEVYEEYEPSWSHDGTKVAFESDRGEGYYDIWVMDLSSGELTRMTNGYGVWYPMFSADDQNIAFINLQSGYTLEVMDISSGTVSTVTQSLYWPDYYKVPYVWSPEGETIAYLSEGADSADIMLTDMESGETIRITDASNYIRYFSISPAGERVVYAIYGDQGNEVRISPAMKDAEPRLVQEKQGDILDILWDGEGRIDLVENQYPIFDLYRIDPAGEFIFSDILLDNGDNIFHASATDMAGNVSLPSNQITLVYDYTEETIDLEVMDEDIIVYPAIPLTGEEATIFVYVRNQGSIAAEEAEVLVYIMDQDWNLESIEFDVIPYIEAGTEQVVSIPWDTGDNSGNKIIMVMLDYWEMISETDEDNNFATMDLYVAAEEGIEMNAYLDKEIYSLNEDVSIKISLYNGGLPTDGELDVTVEDSAGIMVHQFDPIPVSMSYGVSGEFELTWNTGSTYAGDYQVRSVLTTEDNDTTEDLDLFTILPDILIDADLTSDKTHYAAYEDVFLDIKVLNNSDNYIVPLMDVDLSIVRFDYTEISAWEWDLNNLPAGSNADLAQTWNTGISSPGTYQAILSLYYNGGLIQERTVDFEIDPAFSAAGEILPVPEVVVYGNPVTAQFSITNTGNISATALPVRVLVIDPDTGLVTDTGEGTIDLSVGETGNGEFEFATAGRSLKNHKLALQYELEEVAQTIATAIFTISDAVPPDVTILSPEPDSVHYRSFNRRVRVADDVSGVERVEYRTDDSETWIPMPAVDQAEGIYSSLWSLDETEEGEHIIYFRAADRAGNISSPVSVNCTIAPKVDMDMTLDETQYGMNEDVFIDVHLANAGWPKDVTLNLSVVDAGGTTVEGFDPVETGLGSDEQKDIAFTWNTARTYAGDYSAEAILVKGDIVLGTCSVPFIINSVVVFSGDLNITPVQVPVNEDVQAGYSVMNIGNNAAESIPVKVIIRDPEDQAILATQETGVTLGVDETLEGAFDFQTQGFDLGYYEAVLQYTAAEVVHDLDQEIFTVIDITPPEVTVISPEEGGVYSGAFDLSVTVVDDASGVASVEYSIDNGEWLSLPVSDPLTDTYSVVWDPVEGDAGSHTVSYRAKDNSGNVSEPLSISITILIQSPFDLLSGTIDADPDQVFQGLDVSFTYSIDNVADKDIDDLYVAILVIDPDTGETKITLEETVAIQAGVTLVRTVSASTLSLVPKEYRAVLLVDKEGADGPRELAETVFEVLPSLEVSRNIGDPINLLVWINYNCGDSCHCHKYHRWPPCKSKCKEKDGNPCDETDCTGCGCGGCDCPDDTDCIDIGLLQTILEEAVEGYAIVFDMKDFKDELRNPFYTDILILGDYNPMIYPFTEELREKVNSGTGLISSLCPMNWLNDDVLGIRYLGDLPCMDHVIITIDSPIIAEGTIQAYGSAKMVEADEDTIIAGRIESCQGSPEYPAIVLNEYGEGYTVYFAFDLGRTLNEGDAVQIEELLRDSIYHVHKPIDTDTILPGNYVPIELEITSLGSGLDLTITERFDEYLKVYDSETEKWTEETLWVRNRSIEPFESVTLLYYYLIPDEPGDYHNETEVGFMVDGEYIPYNTLSMDIPVTHNVSLFIDDIITELNALSVTFFEKLMAKAAVWLLTSVQERGDQDLDDVTLNIHEILWSIQLILGISSDDITDVRLMTDALLTMEEGKYHWIMNSIYLFTGTLSVEPDPVFPDEDLTLQYAISSQIETDLDEVIIEVYVVNQETCEEVMNFEETWNPTEDMDIEGSFIGSVSDLSSGDYEAFLRLRCDMTDAEDIFDRVVFKLIDPGSPVAVPGGPYIAATDEDIMVDGSGSYDEDEGLSETGEPPFDEIISFDWELDMIEPYDFAEATGEVTIIPGYESAGLYSIGLQVTDNSSAAFPSYFQADLTDAAYDDIQVHNTGVADLVVTDDDAGCILTWGDIDDGSNLYKVMRSQTGPNRGFEVIGAMCDITCFTDEDVMEGEEYWYRIKVVTCGEIKLSPAVYFVKY